MKYKFKASCSKNELSAIRGFVNTSLHKHALTETMISNLVLAIDEICANLIIHSNGCDPNETLELHLNIENKKGITVEILDNGNPFDAHDYRPPTLEEIVAKRKKGGLGLLIVNKIMDKVEFEARKDRNVCRLFKKVEIS